MLTGPKVRFPCSGPFYRELADNSRETPRNGLQIASIKQGIVPDFPKSQNREFILKNREFVAGNRDYLEPIRGSSQPPKALSQRDIYRGISERPDSTSASVLRPDLRPVGLRIIPAAHRRY